MENFTECIHINLVLAVQFSIRLTFYFTNFHDLMEEGAWNLETDRFGPEMRFLLLLSITDMDLSQGIVLTKRNPFIHLELCGKD